MITIKLANKTYNKVGNSNCNEQNVGVINWAVNTLYSFCMIKIKILLQNSSHVHTITQYQQYKAYCKSMIHMIDLEIL